MRSGQLFAAAVVAVTLGAAPAFAGDHKGKITWAASPEAGFAQAKKTGKAVMLFFTASW